ncbi:hypothetical protein [Elizabethkingia sp. JS20170427COW]|uniref:hypothetical protein n=1 Tax=Elizabethkingia sp. JS20170427COW TaxID=2583851 RepID=UPI0011104823|nr:hypothetical protein [Elizabethkingia sp. JS20170427COW]QCX53228.1 hypothetical protein FGE20_05540 [Elizabethkingia sp. JS20170427COW]
MKNIILLGIVFLAIGSFLFYRDQYAWSWQMLYSCTAGLGLGLIFGGIVGYISKGTAIKNENKVKQLKQLQKDKEELEKKQAQLLKEVEKQEKENRNV